MLLFKQALPKYLKGLIVTVFEIHNKIINFQGKVCA